MKMRSRHRVMAILSFVAVAMLGGCGSDDSTEQQDDDLGLPGEVTATAEGVEIGTCYVTPDDLSEMFAAVTSLTPVPCAEPHHLEAIHLFTIEGDGYPSREEMTPAVDDGCFPAFEQFIGTTAGSTTLSYEHLIPSEESWAEGDRTIACLVMAEDGAEVTGSLAGAGPAHPSES